MGEAEVTADVLQQVALADAYSAGRRERQPGQIPPSDPFLLQAMQRQQVSQERGG